ncbi:MAG: hypothetical protein A4E40_00249 [Methanoregulaceae archaeon PtaU1.Bin059]|nr:MAG: hypothetical protein A4E40_00249 [Methanoregulaceae archaeon PtaU1.Bin059]
MRTGFGWIEYRGKVYEHDVIIHTNGRVEKRRKKLSSHLKRDYGHTPLTETECEFLRGERPGVVYIGTGQHGALPLTEGARKVLGGYPTIIGPTLDIIEDMEREERPYAAILHVTC